MDVVITGNYQSKPTHVVHKVLRPGYKLHIGSECNDGRPITESWRYKQAKALGIPIIRKAPMIVASGILNKPVKELLTTKYKPSKISEIIGHKEQIQRIGQWLSDVSAPKTKEQSKEQSKEQLKDPVPKGILITGPPGIGKTTTVHLIAKELGFKVTEYNASDTRSITMLKGILALGMKRLVKEVIVMDEVDGLVGGKERGSVGEIAELIRKSPTPIICIANDKPPKLKPIINVCLDIKFNRPQKATIATALVPIVKAENISISKVELEQLCEKSGNDIRSILNTLNFFEDTAKDKDESYKDQIHRLDLFSATQRLMNAKRMKMSDAEDLVYVDYHMVPLMVQEAYATAAKDLNELETAANLISESDLMNTTIWKTQDWTILPHIVANTVAVAKTVSGSAPFQIFPQFLGKNSKRLKQQRWIDALAKKRRCSANILRLDYVEHLQKSLLTPLQQDKPDIKGLIQRMDVMGVTRDDLMDTLCEVSFNQVEIQTKIKTAFTREWNKSHGEMITHGKKKRKVEDSESDMDSDMEELEEEMDGLDII